MTQVSFVAEGKYHESWWKYVMVFKAEMWSCVYPPCHWSKQFSQTNTMSVGWRYTFIAHKIWQVTDQEVRICNPLTESKNAYLERITQTMLTFFIIFKIKIYICTHAQIFLQEITGMKYTKLLTVFFYGKVLIVFPLLISYILQFLIMHIYFYKLKNISAI